MTDDKGNAIENNWRSMKLVFEDYTVDDTRFKVLADLADQFIDSLSEDVCKYHDDPLSNSFCVHVTGTLEQVNSVLWFEKRVILVTDYVFMVCITCLFQLIRAAMRGRGETGKITFVCILRKLILHHAGDVKVAFFKKVQCVCRSPISKQNITNHFPELEVRSS